MEGLKQAQDSFSMEMSSELFLKGPYDQQEAPFHRQLGESWVEGQPEDVAELMSPTGPHLVQQDEQVSDSQSPAPEGGVKQGSRSEGCWLVSRSRSIAHSVSDMEQGCPLMALILGDKVSGRVGTTGTAHSEPAEG